MSKSKLADATKVTNIQLPAKDKLLNYHVWFMFVSRILFQQLKLTPGFVCKNEREFEAVKPILQYFHEHFRHHGDFKDIVNKVINKASIEDASLTLEYTNHLERAWNVAQVTLQDDIEKFLEEERIGALPTGRAETMLFKAWYQEHYESTSAPHWTAYVQAARGHASLAVISLLMTTFPEKGIVLATPVVNCAHHVKSYSQKDQAFFCASCQERIEWDEMSYIGAY